MVLSSRSDLAGFSESILIASGIATPNILTKLWKISNIEQQLPAIVLVPSRTIVLQSFETTTRKRDG